MFKFLMKSLSFCTTVLAASLAFAQPNSGVTLLNPPQAVENDGKVEVLEFFAYGCIHCASLEPTLVEWKKKQPPDVKLVRVPAAFAVRGVDSVPLFLTLQAMGEIDRLHNKIFVAINNENVNLASPALLNKWLQANGVDPAKYEQLQQSFSVATQIQRTRKMTADYSVNETPVIIVNGRTLVSTAGGPERTFSIVDQLIREARAKLVPAAPTKASAPAQAATGNATAAKAAPNVKPTEKK